MLVLSGFPTPIPFTDVDSAATIVQYARAYMRIGHDVQLLWNDDYAGREDVEDAISGFATFYPQR